MDPILAVIGFILGFGLFILTGEGLVVALIGGSAGMVLAPLSTVPLNEA